MVFQVLKNYSHIENGNEVLISKGIGHLDEHALWRSIFRMYLSSCIHIIIWVWFWEELREESSLCWLKRQTVLKFLTTWSMFESTWLFECYSQNNKYHILCIYSVLGTSLGIFIMYIWSNVVFKGILWRSYYCPWKRKPRLRKVM